ncbi:alpha/beta hydrolase [Mycolicibacterium conceptionense]|uniref:Alpha/beta hydrolase n=1 Tax=Mycolicibacterium conceptionense TaxID=451644 RepID=A0A0U1DIA6_9MYCO|nr:alpha/beta hydrolase [Mycolicibacterium conceptionense]
MTSSDQSINPFRIAIPDADLDDLKARLNRTRWPEAECVEDWNQGIPLDYTKELAAYWANEYDWRAREAALNRFDHFTTEIDGLDIHFIHQRSGREDAFPLVITHGWPGSIVEFHKVIEPLAEAGFEWCARRCPATGSPASPLRPAGASRRSRRPGTP